MAGLQALSDYVRFSRKLYLFQSKIRNFLNTSCLVEGAEGYSVFGTVFEEGHNSLVHDWWRTLLCPPPPQ